MQTLNNGDTGLVIRTKINDNFTEASTAESWYGIQWDINVSATPCARIGKTELHQQLPIQAKMKGCLLLDNGTVNYYLNPLDWTKKEDDTASNLTGTDGQVMVEIPSHYRKFESFLSFRKCKISEYFALLLLFALSSPLISATKSNSLVLCGGK